jgi:hypothetical protein
MELHLLFASQAPSVLERWNRVRTSEDRNLAFSLYSQVEALIEGFNNDQEFDGDLGYDLPRLKISNVWESQTAIVDDHYQSFTFEELDDMRSFNIRLLTHFESGQSQYLNSGMDDPICPDYIANTISILSEAIQKRWIDTLCEVMETVINAKQLIGKYISMNVGFVFFKKIITSLFDFYYDYYFIASIEDEILELMPELELFTYFDFEDEFEQYADYELDYAMEHDGSGC